MIPVTGAGWSQVSGVGGVTEGASATATEDRIVVRWASADSPAGARVEPGCAHRRREPLGLASTAGDREQRTAACSQVPAPSCDLLPGSLQRGRESWVRPACGGLECAPHQFRVRGLTGLEKLSK